jgi:ketosteroid isomerase-like protein
MAGQEDIDLVRKGYEAFIAGDMEWMNEHFHDNVVWHNPGSNAFSGDYKGRENVLGFFARSVQAVIPEFDIHDVLASEDHVVALLTVTWKRQDNGSTIQTRGAQVFHVENEKALEVWTMAEDQSEIDRFLEGVSA